MRSDPNNHHPLVEPETTHMKSFVEFYESEKISPVAQDISDETKHFRRRDALYRTLGIAPGLLRGRHVIEFGPGSGFNSIHTASYLPEHYVLVEGNRYGLEAINQLFARRNIAGAADLKHSMFEAYETEDKFDLVLCEGALPVQPNPVELLNKIASHTDIGGLLVITTMDSVGYLPEILRRFVARFLVRDIVPTQEKVGRLLPVLGPHLSTMQGMSRPHEDWILDNIIQPFAGRKLLGISEAVDALGAAFSVHGSSPRFLNEWRWYKDLTADPRVIFNPTALSLYWEHLHNFLDYRCTPTMGNAERNRRLITATDEIYSLCIACEEVEFDWTAAMIKMKGLTVEVAALVAAYQMDAADDLLDFTVTLDCCMASLDLTWGRFSALFGRGQQYLSFMRHA